jgi:hypothetical protein
MLPTAGKLTKREEEFLTWLLNPLWFGERVPGLTQRDMRKITRAIELLQSVSRPELLETEVEALKNLRASWERRIQTRRTVYASAIQSRSHDGTENIEETRRLFWATLIARKRGPEPYDFLFARFKRPPFNFPKAIEMRVRRFECQLQPGPMSCSWIIHMYSQFLTQRRQKQVRGIPIRCQAGEITFEQARDEFNRLTMPNARENRWLEALCRYARPPQKSDTAIVEGKVRSEEEGHL